MVSTAQIMTMFTFTGLKLAAVAFIAITFASKCTDAWQHEEVLDQKGSFQVNWNLSIENITIEVQVRTKGYVALGFSPHGGMKGADIVTGWVKGSEVFIQDRYATGNIQPVIDDNQDYELISGFENDTHTVLQFTRQLSTCDEKDLPILDMATNVIYAWGTDDPASATTIEYHGAQNRGTKDMNLISPNVDLFQFTDDMIPFDFQMPKVNVLAEETTNWCQYFKVPETGVKKHFVGMQMLLQPGNENIVHHATVTKCSDPFPVINDSLLNGPGFKCENGNAAYAACSLPYVVWAIGNKNETLPAHVGFPFGEIDKPTYYVFSIHYNNPRHLIGIVDQTTIRFMITEKLRLHNAGQFAIIGETKMIIPPKQENFSVAFSLPSKCTKKMFPKDGINIIISFLHGHLTSRKLHLRHFRGGVELPLIDYENDYQYEFQHRAKLLKEVNVLPGDDIVLHCEYNTMDRTNFTQGGASTQDEMCEAYIVYYPLINLIFSYKFGSQKQLLNILETAQRKQVHNNISTRYNLTTKEYVKTFDVSILTKQDISDLSYLQTYGRMQGMCVGRDGAMEIFDVEYPTNDTRNLSHLNINCKKSMEEP